jgi:hypothetical protein
MPIYDMLLLESQVNGGRVSIIDKPIALVALSFFVNFQNDIHNLTKTRKILSQGLGAGQGTDAAQENSICLYIHKIQGTFHSYDYSCLKVINIFFFWAEQRNKE